MFWAALDQGVFGVHGWMRIFIYVPNSCLGELFPRSWRYSNLTWNLGDKGIANKAYYLSTPRAR
jgi:hypothetical protein